MYMKNAPDLPSGAAAFWYFKLAFIVQLRRSRLASLFEGGGMPKGMTEGVWYRTEIHSPSHRPSADDSPLLEGAKDAVHTDKKGRFRRSGLKCYFKILNYSRVEKCLMVRTI